MHIRFLVPPNDYEIDHAAQILGGLQRLEASHVLPDTPFWHAMEFRDGLNHARFEHYHHNIALILKEAERLQALTAPSPVVPCRPVEPGCVLIEPPPDYGRQTVPEPSTAVLLALGLVAALGFQRWSRG